MKSSLKSVPSVGITVTNLLTGSKFSYKLFTRQSNLNEAKKMKINSFLVAYRQKISMK